ncbi:MAG: HAD-IC family P-type ATPase [Candidatus Paceibacterota bacterium]
MHNEAKIFTQLWALSKDEVLTKLDTREKGLNEEEAKSRLALYGSNTFHSKERVNILSLFLKQFVSPLIFLLVGASIMTAFLGEWIDTGVIAFAVLLNVFLGFYHEYNAESTLDKLKTYIKDRARVVRGGIEQEVDSALLVPGDLIKLAYGSRIPADARILGVNNFQVDEAILTGEALPIEKSTEVIHASAVVADRLNIVHAGTLVVQGFATAAVYATGNNTEIGQIAGIVSRTSRIKTPLQKGVYKLAWLIFIVVNIIIIGIFVLGVSRGEPLVPMLLLSVAVAVGAVPESLPIALTVILAIGSLRIAEKRGIIRKLTAAETLGSTTLIMTDKTGTLTMADMQLVGIHSLESILALEKNSIVEGSFSHEQKKLLELALLNIDVSIENPEEDKSKWIFKGRPFEVNIAKACRLHDIPLESVLSSITHLVLPFNSTNKFSVAEADEIYVVMGAPDILLRKSGISKEKYLEVESWIEATSRDGKRLIGIGTVPKKKHKDLNIHEIADIKFLGIFAFFDPIRPEVPKAIKNIESHGIKMVLVTGDMVGTALSVAKSLDWKVSEDESLSGVDIRAFTDEELLNLLSKIKIFARVTPEDKLRIGRLYQQQGEIVAMTGDGVNDAPALKAMDIGISLGSGSDVAKSAADLVLLDDNFETISLAIDEGRKILGNLRKTFVYLMSNSLDQVFLIGGSLIMGLALPLTALQIIWVNLFTGSLPALSFAFDTDIDHERYNGKDLKLIFTKEVKILTFGIGVLSSTLLFFLYYFLLQIGVELQAARSILFVCFSSYVLVIAFSFRSLHQPLFAYKVFSNMKLNLSVLLAAGLLIFTMTVPFMREIFGLAPMPLSWLPFIIFWLIFNIILVEGAKYILRKAR